MPEDPDTLVNVITKLPRTNALTRTIRDIVSERFFARTEVAQNTIAVVAIKFFSALLAMGSSVLAARFLGVSDYGLYSYVWSLLMLLVVPVSLGFPNLLIRNIAAYSAQERWSVAKGLIQSTDMIVLLLSLLAVLAVLMLPLPTQEGITPTILTLTLLLLPIIALVRTKQSTLQGIGRILEGQSLIMILRPVLFIVALIMLAVFSTSTISASSAMLSQILAYAMTLVAGVHLLRKYLPREYQISSKEYHLFDWVRSAMPLLWVTMLDVGNQNAGIIILGSKLGPDASGLYKAAHQLAFLIPYALLSVNVALAPSISSLFVTQKMKRLRRVVSQGAGVAVAISLPLALIFIFFRRPILGLIFGPDFVAAATALAIMSLGQLINVFAGPAQITLIMTGFEKLAVAGMAVALILNVTLAWLLIPQFGVEGASLATSISTAAWGIMLAFACAYKVGVQTSVISFLTRSWEKKDPDINGSNG